MESQRKCSLPGCSNGGKLRRGLCGKHYQRLVAHGDPYVVTRAGAGQGSVSSGYHRLTVNGRKAMVHRRVWEAAHGPIPKGYLPHHKNGDTLDNRLENLKLMLRGKHTQLHRPRRQAECHPDRPRKGNGLCAACYYRTAEYRARKARYRQKPGVHEMHRSAQRRYRARKRAESRAAVGWPYVPPEERS